MAERDGRLGRDAGEPAAAADVVRRRERDARRAPGARCASRLVTLAGPGGAGKTGLGVEAARRPPQPVPDGVWLVRLAPVTEPELLIQASRTRWA